MVTIYEKKSSYIIIIVVIIILIIIINTSVQSKIVIKVVLFTNTVIGTQNESVTLRRVDVDIKQLLCIVMWTR